MKALLAVPISGITGWGFSCVFYAIVACVAFPGPVGRIIDVVYWDCFYTAWNAVAFSIFVLGLLAFAPKIRSSIFQHFGFIVVGLIGGILTWPLGVVGWSVVMYGSIYMPWLVPSGGLDVPIAGIVGLTCITFYGVFLRHFSIRSRA